MIIYSVDYSKLLLINVDTQSRCLADWDIADLESWNLHAYIKSLAENVKDKQAASCNSLHNCLMNLAIDSTALCDMWRWKWHQWIPFGCLYCWCGLCPPLCGYLLTHHSPTSIGIGYASKNYQKWQAIQPVIHSIVGE